MLQSSPLGLPILGFQAATAGTTQTQAGATAMTKGIVKVTSANDLDGVALPRADQPTHIGQSVIVANSSTNTAKVWPYYTSASTNDDGSAYGATIDGGSANAAVTQAASSTFIYNVTAKNTWKSAKLS